MVIGGIRMSLMTEYIKKRMGVKDLENELRMLISEYNKVRNTYLIIYAGAIGKPIPDITLCMDDYYIIFDMLKNVNSNKLDFYIETPGGSGEAAEEVVRFLRSKFTDINFVVSGQAKSAGTILVLSGNEILMTESGSLGPIDAQVQVGRSRISAHDYIEWVKEKRDEAERVGRLNPFDATMVAQISPGELSGVYYSLKFAEDLVVEWLTKYKFKNWNVTESRKIKVTEEMKRKRAQEIAKDLANHGKWRTHGRSIKIDDLEGIGLKITRIDNDPKLADTVYRIQTVIRLLFSSSTTYKIFAIEDEIISKQAVPMGAIPKMPADVQEKEPQVARVEIKCPQCGKKHNLYAKFINEPKIDTELNKEGFKPFPDNNKLTCECGYQIDLTGVRNELETKAGKKIII